MTRILMIVLFAASIATGAEAETRGIVALDGGIWANGARDSIKGRAMVFNLASPESYLSLHTAPAVDAAEIAKLNALAIVELTGETEEEWARLSEVIIEISSTGQLLPEKSRGTLKFNGWVRTAYLCNYMY